MLELFYTLLSDDDDDFSYIHIYICKFYFSSGLFWGIQKFQTSYLEETDVSHHVTLLTAALYRKVKDADRTGL